MRQYVLNDQPWPGTNIAPPISLQCHTQRIIVLWIVSKCQYIQKRRNSISESHLSSSAGRNAVVRQQQGHTILSDSTVRFNRFGRRKGKKLACGVEGMNALLRMSEKPWCITKLSWEKEVLLHFTLRYSYMRYCDLTVTQKIFASRLQTGTTARIQEYRCAC